MKCKLCSSDNTKLLFFANNTHGRHILSCERFAIYDCEDCKVVFTDIQIHTDYYTKYYPENYYYDKPSNAVIERGLAIFKKISFFRKARLIMKYKPKGNKILEIGCAKGNFLHSLPAYFEKHGVEINKAANQYIKEYHKDITIYDSDIGSGHFDNSAIKFDIIVLWHVLEHITNPLIFIKSLSNLLSEEGVIILDTPNRDSIGFNLTKKLWFHLDAPRHLFYFNHKSLKELLDKYNLKVIRYSAVPFDYFHDLSVSFYKMFETRNFLLNIAVAILFMPPTFLVRYISTLFIPRIAEVNTYVVARSP